MNKIFTIFSFEVLMWDPLKKTRIPLVLRLRVGEYCPLPPVCHYCSLHLFFLNECIV